MRKNGHFRGCKNTLNAPALWAATRQSATNKPKQLALSRAVRTLSRELQVKILMRHGLTKAEALEQIEWRS